MKDNILITSVWETYTSARPHIIREGSSAESVSDSRATWGLCYLSLLKKTGKNSRTDLVEVWKTPIGYPQFMATLAYLNFGVAFPTTSKTLFSTSSAESAKET